ncbi:MAG: nucleoside 2-deoxyribosyltransferase [Actinomycetes bacterium]
MARLADDVEGRTCIYLAGPEVFLLPPTRAMDVGVRKKEICLRYGFDAAYPSDEEPDFTELSTDVGLEIFDICVRMMSRCDLVIANMTPFRGVSMDVGTAIEMSYMYAMQKSVFAYSNVTDDYRGRIAGAGLMNDNESVEDYGFTDNLMCEGLVRRSGNEVVRHKAPHAELLTALEGFEECVRQAQLLFGSPAEGTMHLPEGA